MSLVWILLAVVALLMAMSWVFFYEGFQSCSDLEPRGPTKKKKTNKTCCNQNMPALPLSDDL